MSEINKPREPLTKWDEVMHSLIGWLDGQGFKFKDCPHNGQHYVAILVRDNRNFITISLHQPYQPT